MNTQARRLRTIAPLLAICAALWWHAPAQAASHRDAPLVLGPDAQNLSHQKTGTGPLIMYVGAPPPRRTTHVRGARQGRRGRHMPVAAVGGRS